MATTNSTFEVGERSWLNRLLDEYDSLQGVVFILPTIILLSAILYIPFIENGILVSFKTYTLSLNDVDPWVGLSNYEYWLTGAGSQLLYFSIKQTLLYEFIVVPLDVVVGLAVALVLNEKFPGRTLWRGLALSGYASPLVAAGLVFAVMSDAATYGIVYKLFQFFFDIPEAGGLTSNTPWAFWVVVFAKVWRDFGFMMVVFLAGLQSIPAELYEIAKVDGAGPIQRFRNITLPHLSTVILTVVMIRTVFTIGKMEIPWAVTQGGPVNHTSFVALIMFEQGFQQWNLGRAAALGIMFLFVFIPLIAVWIKLEG